MKQITLTSSFSPQDGTQSEGQSKTKQESAWLFRLWYTFDHKYPFQHAIHNNIHLHAFVVSSLGTKARLSISFLSQLLFREPSQWDYFGSMQMTRKKHLLPHHSAKRKTHIDETL